MEISKKTIRNIILGAIACVFVYWILHETERVKTAYLFLKGIFMPFAVGAALAFILNVPMRAIERGLVKLKSHSLRRALAILLTMLTIILVITLVFMLLVPQIQATLESIVSLLPGFFDRIYNYINEFLNDNPQLRDWVNENTDFTKLDWASLIQKAAEVVGNSLTTIFSQAISAVGSIANGVFDGVIAIVFALYCLGRKEILARQGRRLLYSFIPEHWCDECIRVLRLTNSTFSNFISGQCLEALILGVMFMITMSILKLPYVVLVSVIISLTALVPIVGAFVGCILGAFFIMVVSPMQAVIFVGVFLLLQQIEGNMIYPRVVGTSVGLPGMWVLMAVAVGGDIMGVAGMLIMIPLSSVMYALLREFTAKQVQQRGIAPEKLMDHPPELKSGFKAKREKTKDKWIKKKLQKQSEKNEEE